MSNYSSPLIPLEDSPEEFAVEYTSEKYGSDDLGFRHDQAMHRSKSSVVITKKTMVCWSSFAAIFVCSLGILLGRFVFTPHVQLSGTKTPPTLQPINTNVQTYEEIRDLLFNEMNTANIEANLKFLTEHTHIAGSTRDEETLVKYIADAWKHSLDKVDVFPYDVLLSFPNSSSPNFLSVQYPNSTYLFKSNWTEDPVTQAEDQDDVVHVFNAYGAAGTVTGNLFYVNYGRIDDYELLESRNINVTGGICLVRYGKLFRGDKAKQAEEHGCAGLVIFNDPFDYAGEKTHEWIPEKGDKHAYPNSWWLPSTGVQRGTLNVFGDPLTPYYPALNITHRIPESQSHLPNIPVQPIGYLDAYNFLSILGGEEAPADWQGGLNIPYRFGGGFDGNHTHCKAHLHVANFRARRTIKTLIGYIRGWQEPDRYVLLGNHRDAWTFGGLDPSSGTAVVMEVARAMGKLVKNGRWRPRRTIVFCNWGAEEYGLIGSNEWVEQMEKKLFLRAVSYFNIDIAVQGNGSFRALSTPSLGPLLFSVAKEVPNPDASEYKHSRPAVYDTWLAKNYDFEDKSKPYISNIGSGSDYTMFIQKAGVASADLRYTFLNHDLSSYPVYHSVHDTFDYVKQEVDPHFNFSLAVGKIAAGLVLKSSDSLVLPFSPVDYATKLASLVYQLQRKSGDVLKKHKVSLSSLLWAIKVFKNAAINLDSKAKEINSSSDSVYIRQINDQLFQINRGFLDFNGTPGCKFYRHTVFAPSSTDSYSGAAFPGIVDSIFDAQKGGSWEDVIKEISVVSLQILAAADLMNDFNLLHSL